MVIKMDTDKLIEKLENVQELIANDEGNTAYSELGKIIDELDQNKAVNDLQSWR